MSTIVKSWQMAPPAPLEHLRRYQQMSPVLAQVLFNRGYEDPQQAYHFLYDKDLTTNPFLFADMEKAVTRIRQAIHQREPVVVYGDFDADGVTSTTLMMHVLRRLKANVEAYIPGRVDEGYGLNTPALETLAKQGKKLVITVDCGIRSIKEVEDGNAAGLDLIITDHHSIGPGHLPEAVAVINPQREDCQGSPYLAGVGVAFMVARALMLDALARNGQKHKDKYRTLIEELLDLVAIGTVADIMRLDNLLNRTLVRRGLEKINAPQRPGLQALLDVAGLKPGNITAMDIGFAIGPRINAAGRLESAMLAYKLLAAPTLAEARSYAETLNTLNQRRQELTREAQQRIREQIGDYDGQATPLLFVADDHVQPGIVGLVAGRLTEEFYRPTVVLEHGKTESRASCRSIPEFHITHALDACADLLVRHGGHALAAGFTVLNENLPQVQARLMAAAQQALYGRTLAPTLLIDMELSLRQLTTALVEELRALEPTGHANQQPVFLTRNLRVLESRTVGSDRTHLKLKLATEGQPAIDAIGFRLGEWAERLPERLDVVYHLEVNEYNGRRNLQLRLLDLAPAGEQVRVP
ncbi:MAG: single-stranded-DNA-specific exonuclease RecJ [Anaerolineae bacterium]|jgi:single-stranded-DNA-specific exonuclease|nr:single-stranded-DNA-specific exonuclease RecJ [Anaerolineae bacterium]